MVPLLAPALLLFALRSHPHLDIGYEDAMFHVFIVSVAAVCALGVALVSARAGTRSSHYGPVWLSVGCVSVGLLLLMHGLTTPGVLGRPMNLWVGRTPYLAITLFALSLAMAGRSRNTRTSRFASRNPVLTVAVPGALLAGLAVAVVINPRLGGTVPLGFEERAKWVIAGVDCVVLCLLARVHWRRWRLGHDDVQYALVLASAMSMASMLSLRFGELWRLSWWDYHAYLLTGFGAAVYAVQVRYRRANAVDDVLAATFDHDPMTHIVSGYPESLRMLVKAVEAKDRYTHGHSERTATVAVQLGLRVGLNEDSLRVIARGAFLHDVGKIAIPDGILNKPGRLTPEERRVIETHPALGYELVAPAAVLSEVLPIVLHHHEKWDGSGYPTRLSEAAIPLGARVVAVADVWDALTSDRAYRAGMAPEVALAHIIAGRGTHFEPRLVDAMVSLAADWGYVVNGEEGDAEEAWHAAANCHEVGTSRV